MNIDKYKKCQPIIYKTLFSELNNNRISQAYLFEIKNENNSELIRDFIRDILKVDQNEDIKNKYFIIEPDGKNIKKQQIKELKTELSKTSLVDIPLVYLINNADRMNVSSANTILKFLEDPDQNMIGIFVTYNLNNIIDTIKSRCQILLFEKQEEIEDKSKLEDSVKFLNYLKKCEFDNIYNKHIEIYKYDYNKLDEKLNDLLLCLEEDEISQLKKAELIELILEVKKRILSNANIALLVDFFLIRAEEIFYDRSS